MVSIEKQCVKGYILLESLITLGVFVTIVTSVLWQLNASQKSLENNRHEQEILSVASMAIQTKQDYLTLNGISIKVVRDNNKVSIYEKDKEVISLVKE